jgi:hypothetical protein
MARETWRGAALSIGAPVYGLRGATARASFSAHRDKVRSVGLGFGSCFWAHCPGAAE